MTKTKVSNLDFSEVFIRNFFSAAAVNHMSCKEVVLYYAKINSIIQMHAKKCVVMRLQDFLFSRTSFNIGRHEWFKKVWQLILQLNNKIRNSKNIQFVELDLSHTI